MVSLRQLRYFEALARHRHFRRAAQECAVTQPALSMQIQSLEAVLGVALIERRPDAIAITAEGREVARRARLILASVRDLEDCARMSGDDLAGEIALGVIPSIAPYLLPTLLPALAERYPALRLKVRETITRTLIEELAQARVDVVLAALPLEHPEFESVALFVDPFLFAYPRDEASEYPARVRPGDIPRRRLLLLEEGHCLRDQAMRFCAPETGAENSVFGTSSLSTIVQMVANGLGVTLLPAMSVDTELRDDRVGLAPFSAPAPSRTVGLAWRSTSPRKPQFAEFGRFIADWHAAQRSIAEPVLELAPN